MPEGKGWALKLNGVTVSGGTMDGLGCLITPPDGLGLPPIRTEDVTFPQRDGSRHYADWYEPRIITLERVQVCADKTGCPECKSARAKVREILQAWNRHCDDVELVIYTDCHGIRLPSEPADFVLTRTNLATNPRPVLNLDHWDYRGGVGFDQSLLVSGPNGFNGIFRHNVTQTPFDYTWLGGPYASQSTLTTESGTRTNLITNPRPFTNSTNWAYQSGTSGADTESLHTELGNDGMPGFFRATIDTADTGGSSGHFYREDGVVSGAINDTVFMSMYVRPSVDITYSASMQLRSGGGLSESLIGSSVLCPAGVWTRVSGSMTATAAYDGFQIWVRDTVGGAPPVGATVDATQVLIEESATLEPYFDGDNPGEGPLYDGSDVSGLAGDDLVLSMYVRPTTTISYTPRATIQPADGTAPTYYTGASRSCNAGVWTRVSLIVNDIPFDYSGAEYWLREDLDITPPDESDIDVADILIEKTDSLEPYFDGDFPDTVPDDYGSFSTYNWSGTQYASTSEEMSIPDAVESRVANGPYGVIGRPRLATVDYRRGKSGCAEMTLRFDAVDHRMYVLDSEGTPGGGAQTLVLSADTVTQVRCYNKCYDSCYDTPTGTEAGAQCLINSGDECAPFTIQLFPFMQDPVIENVTTGEMIGYVGFVENVITIDTSTGTATNDFTGEDVTSKLFGDTRMTLEQGENCLRLRAYSGDGIAIVSMRQVVTQA